MDELPALKKQRGSIRLPCGKRPVLEDYKFDVCDVNSMTIRVLGGVA
jgi:hypothetical protein